MNIIEFKSTRESNARKKKVSGERKPRVLTQEEDIVLQAKGGLEMLYLKINVELLIGAIKDSPVLGVVFNDELEQQIRSLLLEGFNDSIANEVFMGRCPEPLSTEEAHRMYNQMYINLEDKYLPLEEKNGVFLSVDERAEKQQGLSEKIEMFPTIKKR